MNTIIKYSVISNSTTEHWIYAPQHQSAQGSFYFREVAWPHLLKCWCPFASSFSEVLRCWWWSATMSCRLSLVAVRSRAADPSGWSSDQSLWCAVGWSCRNLTKKPRTTNISATALPATTLLLSHFCLQTPSEEVLNDSIEGIVFFVFFAKCDSYPPTYLSEVEGSSRWSWHVRICHLPLWCGPVWQPDRWRVDHHGQENLSTDKSSDLW